MANFAISKHVYNKNGVNLLRVEQCIPVCGQDFCDSCGDCLHCYWNDPCYHGKTDEHFWVEYEDTKEMSIENG